MLRLKLQVQTILDRHIGPAGKQQEVELAAVELAAVYEESGPNKQWSQWTPSGSFKFTISNPAALDKLKVGMYVYADLTECSKDSI